MNYIMDEKRVDDELQRQQDIHGLPFVMRRYWYAHGCKAFVMDEMSSTWIEYIPQKSCWKWPPLGQATKYEPSIACVPDESYIIGVGFFEDE
jgi:hypothetical protein